MATTLLTEVKRGVTGFNKRGPVMLKLLLKCIEHPFEEDEKGNRNFDTRPLAWMLAKSDSVEAQRIFRVITGKCVQDGNKPKSGFTLDSKSDKAKKQDAGIYIGVSPYAHPTDALRKLREFVEAGLSYTSKEVKEYFMPGKEKPEYDVNKAFERFMNKAIDEGATIDDIFRLIVATRAQVGVTVTE